jgi:hypothetical protein
MTIARNLSLPKGSMVVMDKAYVDYGLIDCWSQEGIFFVTRLKKNAFSCLVQPKVNPGKQITYPQR